MQEIKSRLPGAINLKREINSENRKDLPYDTPLYFFNFPFEVSGRAFRIVFFYLNILYLDTFDLQMSILTGIPPPDYREDYVDGGDLEQSQIREIGELAFEVFDEPTFVFNSEPGAAPFTMEMPSIDLSSLGSEETNAELMVGDLR